MNPFGRASTVDNQSICHSCGKSLTTRAKEVCFRCRKRACQQCLDEYTSLCYGTATTENVVRACICCSTAIDFENRWHLHLQGTKERRGSAMRWNPRALYVNLGEDMPCHCGASEMLDEVPDDLPVETEQWLGRRSSFRLNTGTQEEDKYTRVGRKVQRAQAHAYLVTQAVKHQVYSGADHCDDIDTGSFRTTETAGTRTSCRTPTAKFFRSSTHGSSASRASETSRGKRGSHSATGSLESRGSMSMIMEGNGSEANVMRGISFGE
ncbi:unnamed protein product [Chrysoparadoxa australica]